ncbi:MAG TPA: glycine cleavage system protein GcvH [Pseudonocardiaceae bacterium]|nr:glycine cleavage system protein GcvH [Pseudonocardiaceae bacterium]
MVPEDLKYTPEHEWVQRTGADTVRVGITDYAQQQMGDVVFVRLPEVGQAVAPGDAVGEVESTKSVSDVFVPLAGEVVASNGELDSSPELVNTDPYGDGWMIEIRLADSGSLESLLDSSGYRELIEE